MNLTKRIYYKDHILFNPASIIQGNEDLVDKQCQDSVDKLKEITESRTDEDRSPYWHAIRQEYKKWIKEQKEAIERYKTTCEWCLDNAGI